MTDAELAELLAKNAGDILLGIRRNTPLSAQTLGRLGDELSNSYLMKTLEEVRPDDAVLSEESADDLGRLNNSRVWIVDPLDGTREFTEHRNDWAVHVALCIDGQPRIGAVALPAVGQTLCSASVEARPPIQSQFKIAISRSRPPEFVSHLADTLGAELAPMGSAGAKAMAVVNGDVQAYIHAGGQYEWDSAAPVAVALAAGLHASRLDGSPLTYNHANTLLPDLVICRPELAEMILAEIQRQVGEIG